MDTQSTGMGTMRRSSLATAKVGAVLRAENLERAKKYYSETLGLEVTDAGTPGGEVMVMAGEGTGFTIYERQGMAAPQNTTLTFMVKDFDATMMELKDRGVRYEEYDIPEIGLKTVNGVAVMDGYKTAWFLDTEGNILTIASM